MTRMMNRLVRAWSLIGVISCVVFSGCATPIVRLPRPLPREAIPQVVAVSSFDNRSGFAGQWKLGSGMADLLVSELVKCKNFVVVERKHLDTVVSELDRQKDKRFRPEGKVDEGRLKSARYLIRGVINDFSQVGGGTISVAIRNLLFGGKGYKARVALALTIVDVETGEIVDSVQCTGTARAREVYAKAEYKNVAFGGNRFFNTPLGIATSNTIRRGIRGIVGKMPLVLWEPMIAVVSHEGRIILNGGSDRGVKKGSVYDVLGESRPVTDPVTGDLLSIMPGPAVGTIRVTEVESKIAFAEVVKGTQFRRGQRLIRVSDRPKK